jgi:hypothetical protein
MKSGNLNFLEPSGIFRVCNGTLLPLLLHEEQLWYVNNGWYVTIWKLMPQTFTMVLSIFTISKTRHFVTEDTCYRNQSKSVKSGEASAFTWSLKQIFSETHCFILNVVTAEKVFVNVGDITPGKTNAKDSCYSESFCIEINPVRSTYNLIIVACPLS